MNIKEAIEKCKMFIDNGETIQTIETTKDGISFATFDTTPIETVLAELEKKDRIINKMAEQLTTDIHSKEWVIDYYEREVEK